jgi:molybdate transport system substrate-binding protein
MHLRLHARRTGIALLVATLLGLFPGLVRAADRDSVTVFAAASLSDALQALAAEYRRERGIDIRFSFAASSTLARQIEAGAPADIFVSANAEWMDYLAGKSLIEPASRVEPLGNALVMIAPADNAIQSIDITQGFDIAGLIGKGNRLAAGDPAHVPAGLYAEKALRSLKVWSSAEPLLARADSVRSALVLVERGEAPLGIVYATDALASPKVKIVGTFPQNSYPPIVYPFAIVAGRDTSAARTFLQYLTAGTAASVYRHFGFVWRGPAG